MWFGLRVLWWRPVFEDLHAISADDFRRIMGRFAAGVTVITTVDETGRPFGLTATAFSSLSKSPPLCLVCVDHRAEAHPVIAKHSRFAVNMLTDEQQALSDQFAQSDPNKFDGVDWEPGGVTGAPLLAGVLAAAECELVEAHTGGDHDIFVGALKSVRIGEGRPLVYWNGKYGELTSR